MIVWKAGDCLTTLVRTGVMWCLPDCWHNICQPFISLVKLMIDELYRAIFRVNISSFRQIVWKIDAQIWRFKQNAITPWLLVPFSAYTCFDFFLQNLSHISLLWRQKWATVLKTVLDFLSLIFEIEVHALHRFTAHKVKHFKIVFPVILNKMGHR